MKHIVVAVHNRLAGVKEGEGNAVLLNKRTFNERRSPHEWVARPVTGVVGIAVGVSAASSAFALGNGYTPGAEGAMGATLLPLGFHYKQYNILVDTDELQDEGMMP